MKKWTPRRNWMKAKKIKFLSYTTMVTPLGFLKQGEMLAEFFGRGKGRPVDALEHLVFFVSPPIRASHAGELKGRYATG